MDVLEGFKWYMVFVLSTALHEAAHAWAAWKMGDPTAHQQGLVSLDPTRHMVREPLGMVVIPLLTSLFAGWTIGWGSCPYDRPWALAYPRRSAWMALAGPAANLLLVLLAAILIRIGIVTHFFEIPDSISFAHVVEATDGPTSMFLAKMVSLVFSLNLLLCAFNLLPLPPLDGSGVLPLFLSRSNGAAVIAMMWTPGMQFFGMMVAWRLFSGLHTPIQLFAVNLLYPGTSFM